MDSLRLLIPTYGRAGSLTTLGALPDLPYEIACHTEQERDRLLSAQSDILPERVHVTHLPTGPVGGVRQLGWLCERFGTEGTWDILADDNVRRVTGVSPEVRAETPQIPVGDKTRTAPLSYGGTSWSLVFSHIYTTEMFLTAVREDIAFAEQLDYWMIGFATTPAWLYRGKHYRRYGYACSKLMLWRHDGSFPWESMTHMWDTHMSAEQHWRHGGVLVDEWLYPVAPDFAPGGLGSYETRIPWLRDSADYLTQRYPGLLKVVPRTGFVENTAVAFAIHSQAQAAAWRRSMTEAIR